jgi:hypothetical protein
LMMIVFSTTMKPWVEPPSSGATAGGSGFGAIGHGTRACTLAL